MRTNCTYPRHKLSCCGKPRQTTYTPLADTWIGIAAPDTNHNGDGLLHVWDNSDILHAKVSIVQFGVVALAGATNVQASLALKETTGAAGCTITLQRLTRADWDEATATWNIYKAASNWTAPGGDVSTPILSFAWDGRSSFTIPNMDALAQDAIDSRSGKLILHISSNGTEARFADSSTATPPTLTVTR